MEEDRPLGKPGEQALQAFKFRARLAEARAKELRRKLAETERQLAESRAALDAYESGRQ